MKKILPGLVLLALAILACRFGQENPTPTAVPTYTQYPTFTPYPPTPVPSTPTVVIAPDVVSALLENGFVQSGNGGDCAQHGPCTDYWNQAHKLLVTIYSDGIVGYVFPINNDSYVSDIMDKLMVRLYGTEVDTWIATHIDPAKSSRQTGTVNGFNLGLEYVPATDTTSPLVMIFIIPNVGY